MSSLSDHTAPGQALGYFFQLERSLYWLAKAPQDSVIGIETEDDIVVKLLNGESIFEQDKSSVDSHPFLPGKKDLWKSLLIWAEAINSGEINVDYAYFFLVTNKPKANSLALIMSEANTEEKALAALNELKAAGSKITGEVKGLIDKLFCFPEDVLVNLILRVNYQGGGVVYGETLKGIIIGHLQLNSDDDEQCVSIIRQLFGWVFDKVLDCWRNKRQALLERNEFVRLKNTLITRYRQSVVDSVLIELGEIPDAQEQGQMGNTYVKQLELIKCDKSEIQKAIFEYLNSVTSRTRLAKKGYLSGPELDELDRSLQDRWEGIFKLNKIIQRDLSPELVGKVILLESLNYDTSIGSFVLKSHFLTKGSYHALADKLKVGWHPEYETHFLPHLTVPVVKPK